MVDFSALVGKDTLPGPVVTEPQLNADQQNALEILKGNNNVFLTGPAGAGKSFLLRQYLQNRRSPILAPTGMAALLVNGRTFHSFFGIGLVHGGVEATLLRALQNRKVTDRIEYCHEIVIDEISMVSGELLALAEKLCRKIRRSADPWGGIRMIVVGDFYQLPPICEDKKPDWAFKHAIWKTSDFRPLYLKTIMRTQDAEFIDILNRIRLGKIDKTVEKYLNSKVYKGKPNGFDGTHIYARNKAVDSYNSYRLDTLEADLVKIPTRYDCRFPDLLEKFKKALVIPETLELKVGALVMTRTNDNVDKLYVNGSLCHVKEIKPRYIKLEKLDGTIFDLEEHKFEWKDGDNRTLATAMNFPITLAYAITGHKAQGSSIDKALIELSGLWDWGQFYTSISRLKSGEGLHIRSWDEESCKTSKKVVKFYESFVK